MKYRIEVDVTSDSLADAVEDAKKILDDLGTYGSLGDWLWLGGWLWLGD